MLCVWVGHGFGWAAASVCAVISWLRVSLAVWPCVELEPVLATAGADYARHWRGGIARLCAARGRWGRRRQQRSGDGRGAEVGNAVRRDCLSFVAGGGGPGRWC